MFPARELRPPHLIKKLRYSRFGQIAPFVSLREPSRGDLARVRQFTENRNSAIVFRGCYRNRASVLSSMLTRTLCKCRAFHLRTKSQDRSTDREIVREILRSRDLRSALLAATFKKSIIFFFIGGDGFCCADLLHFKY